jgi:hypothetical protein
MGLEEHLERFQSRFRCLHKVPRELPVNRAVSGLFGVERCAISARFGQKS